MCQIGATFVVYLLHSFGIMWKLYFKHSTSELSYAASPWILGCRGVISALVLEKARVNF